MSKDNVRQMFVKFEKDADLRKKYMKLMQEHQKETEKELAAKLIGFGKNAGFSFSKDDLLGARSEIMDASNSNAELNDGDLAKVAGGGLQKFATVTLSITTFGAGCAIMSIWAAADKVSCASQLTTSDAKCKEK